MTADAFPKGPVSGKKRRLAAFLLGIAVVAGWAVIGMKPFTNAAGPASTETDLEPEAIEQFVQLMIEAPSEAAIAEPVITEPKPPEPLAENHSAAETPAAKNKIEATPKSDSSPDIVGRFDVPVMSYVHAVQKRAGGKLLVWDAAGRQAVGEVVNGRFNRGVSLENFSNRARDLTDDLPNHYRRKVIAQLGSRFGIWRFVLVVPVKAEAEFRNAVAGALSFAGLEWSEVDLLKVRYGLSEDRVIAHIDSAQVKGRRVGVDQAAVLW
jgi:hypothetical protein